MSAEGAARDEAFAAEAADVRLLARVDHRVVLQVLRRQERCANVINSTTTRGVETEDFKASHEQRTRRHKRKIAPWSSR